MKNYEKYTSPEQRSGAFWDVCQNGTENYTVLRAMLWLEEDTETPLPCPFCGCMPECRKELHGKYRVVCTNSKCWYSGPILSTEAGAIFEHNRVTRAARREEGLENDKK